MNQRNGDCLQYGFIIEKEAKRNVTICGLAETRSKLIYTSSFNTVQVVTEVGTLRDTNTGSTILLAFEGETIQYNFYF